MKVRSNSLQVKQHQSPCVLPADEALSHSGSTLDPFGWGPPEWYSVVPLSPMNTRGVRVHTPPNPTSAKVG